MVVCYPSRLALVPPPPVCVNDNGEFGVGEAGRAAEPIPIARWLVRRENARSTSTCLRLFFSTSSEWTSGYFAASLRTPLEQPASHLYKDDPEGQCRTGG